MATTTDLSNLVINYLTDAQYETALANNQVNADEIYMTPNVVGSFYQATGSTNSSVTLSSNTITQVTLVSTNALYRDINGVFSIVDGGIRVSDTGLYKITASVYISATSNGGANSKDVFVRLGTTFSGSTEVLGGSDNVITTSTASGTIGGVHIGPKIVSVDTANQNFYLCCRARNGTGTYYPNSIHTYLLVERVG